MKLTFEGKWESIRNIVQQLEDQGWVIRECTGEPDFIFTRVEIDNEVQELRGELESN